MSSPPSASRSNTYVIRSSSPDLPSLGDIFKKSPKRQVFLRGGSNAAAIPTAARSTFTSAANILREAPEIDIDTERITYSPPKSKPAGKSRAKPQSANDTPGATNVQEVQLSPKRFKPNHREQNSTTDQSALPKARVTKATALNKGKAKKKAETISKHLTICDHEQQDKPSEKPVAAAEPEESSQPKRLALARRIDWTPPRANSAPIILDSEGDHEELLSSIEKAAASKDVFQCLFDEFAHKKTQEVEPRVSREQSETVRDVLKKRKRLDLIATSSEKHIEEPRKSSPIKQPVTKKKTTTITELATRAYAAPQLDIDLLAPGNKESLLRYFDTDGHVKSLVEHQSILMDRNNEKEKPKKKTAKPRKKKGATIEDPILLSPSSALKQSVAQDFVFGTSSQLVTEDSPRTLRNLQAAIKASMQMQEDDPFASSPTTHVEKRRGLWHAGTRDDDGDLLEADEFTPGINAQVAHQTPAEEDFQNIDNFCTNSPQMAKRLGDPSPHSWQPQQHIQTSITTGMELLSAFEPPPSTQPPPSAQPPLSSQPPSPSQPSPLRPSSPFQPPSSQPPLPSSPQASPKRSSAPKSAVKPKYELFTDGQLAKQINSYGFKPMKRRSAMIALLDQCWASQHPGISVGSVASFATSTAKSSLEKKKPLATNTTNLKTAKKARGRPRKNEQIKDPVKSDMSPKKTRGRPRKSSIMESDSDAPLANRARPALPAKRKKAVTRDAEIADSENDDSLSLSGESVANSIFSSTAPLDLALSEEGETSLNLNPTEQEAILFTHITKAVTSAPRSTDPNDPSWHEKMLIYDPVVLEELTAWLNTGQLTRVGHDGEVSPTEVKKWCESKSIICLWKATTRGKERKRY